MQAVTPRRLVGVLGMAWLLLLCTQAPSIAQGNDSHGSTTTICTDNGVCTVIAHDPGGGIGGGSGSGGSRHDRCTWKKNVVPCTADKASFNPSDGCYYKVADPFPAGGPVLDAYKSAGGGIYWANCPFGGSGGFIWLAQPPAGIGPTPGQLAQNALATLTLTKPSTGRYPAGRLQDGQPYGVVRAYTWFWTDPADFKALSARADAATVWAAVTVKPVALSFTPGDGSAATSCAGPGSQWTQGDGVWAASPSGCDYQYPHSSIHDPHGEVTATYAIRWTVTWVGSGNSSGTLPDQTTSSTSTFAVAEVESVVTH